MPGFSDYLAQATLDFQSGRAPMPAIGNRFLALFTAAPTADAGTGGTEVSGGSYARVQVAGAVTSSNIRTQIWASQRASEPGRPRSAGRIDR